MSYFDEEPEGTILVSELEDENEDVKPTDDDEPEEDEFI